MDLARLTLDLIEKTTGIDWKGVSFPVEQPQSKKEASRMLEEFSKPVVLSHDPRAVSARVMVSQPPDGAQRPRGRQFPFEEPDSGIVLVKIGNAKPLSLTLADYRKWRDEYVFRFPFGLGLDRPRSQLAEEFFSGESMQNVVAVAVFSALQRNGLHQ